MKGDFTRFTFDARKHYSSVRMQQGRVLIDSDWNEQLDIEAYRDAVEVKDIIGLNGVPQSVENGFKITVESGKNIRLGKGRCYVNGLLCENEGDTHYPEQPDLPDAQLPDEKGHYLAYLEVWQRHITAIEDPSIREQALGGADTTTRTKTIWQCKFLKVTETGENPEGDQSSSLREWDEFMNRSQTKGTLRVQSGQTPNANYENALYRVEIHQSGSLGEATFKWSRNNGTNVAKIHRMTDHKIIIDSNSQADFSVYHWLEVSDERDSLLGLPGVFVELTEVNGRELHIEKWPENRDSLYSSTSIVRGWESAPMALNSSKNNRPHIKHRKHLPIEKAENCISLENELELQFEEGNYISGDYWLIPMRSPNKIDWKNPQAPHGIDRHYGLLATLHFDGHTWTVVEDCREIFTSLTEATKRIRDLERGIITFIDKEKETLKIKGKIQLEEGVSISQFSNDGSFKKNSDDRVPTERAVKTYVDSKWESTLDNPLRFRSGSDCADNKLVSDMIVQGCQLGYSVIPLYLRVKEKINVKLEGKQSFTQAQLIPLPNQETSPFLSSRELNAPEQVKIDVIQEMSDEKLKHFLQKHLGGIKAQLIDTEVEKFQFTCEPQILFDASNASTLVVDTARSIITLTEACINLIIQGQGKKGKQTTLQLGVEDPENKHEEGIKALIEQEINESKWENRWREVRDFLNRPESEYLVVIARETEKALRKYYLQNEVECRWIEPSLPEADAALEVTLKQNKFTLKKDEAPAKPYLLFVTYS